MSWKQKRIRKPGTLEDLRKKSWQSICEAEKILLKAEDDNVKLKAVYALATATGSYMKILESTEIEERLTKLEEVHHVSKKAS